MSSKVGSLNCHDVQAESKNKRSNVVWDTLGSMKKHQDVWKARKMCVGPPRAAADVGGGARSHHDVGREHLTTRTISGSKNEARKTFCYFGTHCEFKNF